MKVSSILIAAHFALLAPAVAELRSFVSSTGESIKAELVSHAAGKVRIKREDGREFEVDPAVFCKEDEKIIRDWMATQAELASYRFRFNADKKVMDRDSYSGAGSCTRWAYEISLTNDQQNAVNGITVKYRVLYNNGEDRMMEGQHVLDQQLEFNRSLVVTTETVELYKDRDSSYYRNAGLKGCLVRVLDPQGRVVADWVSNDVGMRDKTWENTAPRDECAPAGPKAEIR